ARINALVEEALHLAYQGTRAQAQCSTITLLRDFAPPMPSVEVVPQAVPRVRLTVIASAFHAAHRRHADVGNGSSRPGLHVAARAARNNGEGGLSARIPIVDGSSRSQ